MGAKQGRGEQRSLPGSQGLRLCRLSLERERADPSGVSSEVSLEPRLWCGGSAKQLSERKLAESLLSTQEDEVPETVVEMIGDL